MHRGLLISSIVTIRLTFIMIYVCVGILLGRYSIMPVTYISCERCGDHIWFHSESATELAMLEAHASSERSEDSDASSFNKPARSYFSTGVNELLSSCIVKGTMYVKQLICFLYTMTLSNCTKLT